MSGRQREILDGLHHSNRALAGRKALIVVTDGEDTSSRIPYDDLLKYARAAHVPIYFIGIGITVVDFGASSAIRNLAAETGGVAWFIRNTEQLADTYERLGRELRSQYLIGYYAQATKGDEKYRTIEVGVTRPGLKVRTVRGYIP
jgi:VWFA-related protein